MKRLFSTTKRLFSKKNLQLFIMLLATFAMLNNSIVTVYADSDPVSDEDGWKLEDLQASKDGWAWFNSKLNRCELAGGGAITATGPAVDLLKKAGLDNDWINVIVKYADKHHADPLAMAALLFWENRGFPAYKKTGWANSGSVGSGPWQITSSTWPKSAGPYPEAADDPDTSTDVAANIVASYGGVAGYALGAINQNFGKNANLKTIATLAKNYNAGQASYRTPGVADWNQPNRVWFDGVQPWSNISPTKPGIIDNYIVAMTYLYYQIATGTKISFKDEASYVKEGVSNTDKIKNFAWKPTDGAGSGSTPTATDNSGSAPVIVLDPGHTLKPDKTVDPASNIAVWDYSNLPGKEMSNMWDIANTAKSQLEKAGYKVIITKDNEDGTDKNGKPNTDLKQRADVATQNKAALGISFHTTPGSGTGDGSQNMIFIPKVGNWRLTYDGKTKKTYTNQTLADTDASMAKIFQKTRADALGTDIKNIRVGSYEELEHGTRKIDVPGGYMEGSVLTTQYFATTPWVYFEQAQDGPNKSLKQSTIDAYVKGIVDGVLKAVPVSGNATANGSCGGGTDAGIGQGDIVKTALYYAWDTPGHGMNKGDAKPTYQRDMPKYDGATGFNPYSDCGVFVATVMIASGADPNYAKRGTTVQEDYVKHHPELFTQVKPSSGKTFTTKDVAPGDIVLINGSGQGHTFIYTGTYKGGDGKTYDSASASLNGHVPETASFMGSQEYFLKYGVGFTVWRVKH